MYDIGLQPIAVTSASFSLACYCARTWQAKTILLLNVCSLPWHFMARRAVYAGAAFAADLANTTCEFQSKHRAMQYEASPPILILSLAVVFNLFYGHRPPRHILPMRSILNNGDPGAYTLTIVTPDSAIRPPVYSETFRLYPG